MRCWVGLKLKNLNRLPADEILGGLPLDSLLEHSQPGESKFPEKPVARTEVRTSSPSALPETKPTPPGTDDDYFEAYFKRLAEED